MPQPLDLTCLHRLCKGNRARMEDYVALYLQEAPELFNQLAAELSCGDGSRCQGHVLARHLFSSDLTGLRQTMR